MRIALGEVRLVCEVCGKRFTRRRSMHWHQINKRKIKGIYCSRPCGNKAMLGASYEGAAEDYGAGLTLDEIGVKLGVSASAVRKHLIARGVQLRSTGDHMSTDKNPTKGKGHTAEAKEKIREANRRQFSDPAARALASHNQRRAMEAGKFPSVSSIEGMVAAELDRRGISFKQQVGIKDPSTGQFCACVDFLLSGRMVIEVNGTYWHADPRFYPDGPVHASQKRGAAIYARKMAALVRLGYRVVEIWETEIRADVTAAVDVALG